MTEKHIDRGGFDALFDNWPNPAEFKKLGDVEKHQEQLFEANLALQKYLRDTVEILASDTQGSWGITTAFERLREVVDASK